MIKNNNDSTKNSWLLSIPIVGAVICGFFYHKRSKHLQKRQQKVNEIVEQKEKARFKQPARQSNDGVFIIKVDSCEDYELQEVPMDEEEKPMWNSFISSVVGNTAQASVTMLSFDKLLVCDVPLSVLTKVKDNPELLRGTIMQDGKIVGQAKFERVGLQQITPMLVFQISAFATSQYYQHQILQEIEIVSENIKYLRLEAIEEKEAKTKVALERILELWKHSSYSESEKGEVDMIYSDIHTIRCQCQTRLNDIDLKIGMKWTEIKTALAKTKKLSNSFFFRNYFLWCATISLEHIINLLLCRMASSLNNNEQFHDYLNRFEALKKEGVEESLRILRKKRNEMKEYLQLCKDHAYIKKSEIDKIAREINSKFEHAEGKMKHIDELTRVRVYLKKEEDGSIKKYIPKE